MAEKNSLTLQEAGAITGAVIYGLHEDGSDEIVYVGQTRSARRRFYAYRYPAKCHNSQLAAWLSRVNARVALLERNPENLNGAEQRHISSLRPKFNLAHGGEQAWRNHESLPWMAGQDTKCPSDVALTWLHNRAHRSTQVEQVKRLRAEMSPLRRVLFELGVCEDLWERHRKQMEAWLDRTAGRLAVVLRTGTYQANG